MENSKIEWTDATWNPVRGCRRVSEGCRNCYAQGIAARFSGEGKPYEGLAQMTPSGPNWTGEIALIEDALETPLRWKKPRRIFVNSMSDLFHEDVPFEFIDRVMAVIAMSAQHTFQVLTKRPEIMMQYFNEGDRWADRLADAAYRMFGDEAECHTANAINGVLGPGHNVGWPMGNLWLGTSVENQKAADRIDYLVRTRAAVRFLSCEPLLGQVDLSGALDSYEVCGNCGDGSFYQGRRYCCDEPLPIEMPAIDWVIAGGESGPNARPMHPSWARGLQRQCQAQGIPFFFKQYGEWAPGFSDEIRRAHSVVMSADGAICTSGDSAILLDFCRQHPQSIPLYRAGKKLAGRTLDGCTWDEFPTTGNEVPHLEEFDLSCKI